MVNRNGKENSLIKINIMAVTSFTKIPYSSPDLNTQGRGVEQWHNFNVVNVPSEGTNTQRMDVYYRSPLTWAKIEKAKNQYDWSPVINMLNNAISKRQKVTIGIMSVYHDNEDGVISYDGGNSAYPLYLHQEMQSESVKDWKAGSGWVPNYNSPKYIDAQRRINASLNNLLETGSSGGTKYKDVVNSIDVRGYGNYGEWHNGGIVDLVSQIPSGAHATTASLKAIIDAHTQTIPNFQLSIIMTAFDANWLQHTRTSAEVAYYALTTRNAYGPLGWRRDNWGATDNYIRDLLVNNTRSFNGVQLNSLIMNVWKVAPITGEPMNTAPNEYGDLENQVRLYHAASFGNGNINQSITTGVKNNVRAASKACGYRIVVESIEVPATPVDIVTITTKLRNEGIAPPYHNWHIVFEVKNGSVVKSAKSGFNLKLFQPAGVATTVVDKLSFDVPAGTYELRFRVIDPTGYMAPMPLYITAAKGSDGSYSLGNVTLTGDVVPPPVNKPPVVSAGPDREITFPVKYTTLVGTASDADGTIKSSLWSFVSGPATPVIVTPGVLTTNVNFEKEGTYVFRLIGTDDKGATSVDEVTVKVNSEVTEPTQKTVINVTTVSTVTTKSTVHYSDGSKEEFPKV